MFFFEQGLLPHEIIVGLDFALPGALDGLAEWFDKKPALVPALGRFGE